MHTDIQQSGNGIVSVYLSISALRSIQASEKSCQALCQWKVISTFGGQRQYFLDAFFML